MKLNWLIKDRIPDEKFVEICQTSPTMAQAASKLGLRFNSFKKRALELNCYNPNQAGIGIRKNTPKIPIEDIIFKNLHPHYQSFKLKARLFNENHKKNQCEVCNITEWEGKPIKMELHHKDGNRSNHHLDNLMILCPNCHSQTDTFRAKNKKKKN
jgi:hypothetical protein